MSRLARNEILRQYKKLHQEDVAQQRQQQEAERANGNGLSSTQEDGDRKGGPEDEAFDHGSDGETNGVASSAPAVEEVEHDVDEFQEIAPRLGHDESGAVRKAAVAVPPLVAKASVTPSSPLGNGSREREQQEEQRQQRAYGADLDDVHDSNGDSAALAVATPEASTPSQPAAHAPDGGGDEVVAQEVDDDEFPDLDEVAHPTPTTTAPQGAGEKYVSPVEQLRSEQRGKGEDANDVAGLVSSSTSDDEGEQVETSSSESHSRNTPPAEPVHSRGNSAKYDEATGTALTVSAMTAATTAAAAASAALSHGEGAPLQPNSLSGAKAQEPAPIAAGKPMSPLDVPLAVANSTFLVSNTSVDDPTSFTNSMAGKKANQGRAMISAESSEERMESVCFGSTRPLSSQITAAEPPKRSAPPLTTSNGSLAGLDVPPRSPAVPKTASGAASPLTPAELVTALRQSRAEAANSDDDEDAWVAPHARAAATAKATTPSSPAASPPAASGIDFWSAVVAIYADKQSWLPYAPTNASANTMSHPPPTAKKRKKKSFLFSCCGGGGNDEAVSEKGQTQTASSAGGGDVADANFVAALRAMPLKRTNAIHERVLQSVYRRLVSLSPRDELQRDGAHDRAAAPAVSWELVGFQGANPATDLRASGFLGLLSILYLIDHYPLLTHKLWQLCNPLDYATAEEKKGIVGTNNDLPFVLIAFNFLGVVQDLVLRDGREKMVSVSARNRSSCYVTEVNLGDDPAFVPLPLNSALGADGDTLRQFPLLHAMCEGLVGILEVFYESWLALKRTKRPALPFVGDFGLQKTKVRDMVVSAPHSLDLVMRSAAKARSADKIVAVEASLA